MGHYVYKYVKDNEVLYVGKNDTDLHSRIACHGGSGDNITKDARDEINSAEIYYTKLVNKEMSEVVESELIRLYKPKYNIAKTSKWDGLDFVEEQLKWHKYKKPDKKPEKPEKKNAHATKINYYEKNKKSVGLLHFILDNLLNQNFYITQEYKNNYAVPVSWRDKYKLFIDATQYMLYSCPDFKECNFIEATRCSMVIVPQWRGYEDSNGETVDTFIFNVELMKQDLKDCVNTINNTASNCKLIDHITPELSELNRKASLLFENWDEYINLNNSKLMKEPPPDPGKNIKRLNDKAAKRNDRYFWKWYEGCRIIYTNGVGYYIWKDGKWSEFICNSPKSPLNIDDYRNTMKGYFLEDYIDYYFDHWAIDVDKVVWVTSLGTVFCGDYIGYFEHDMYDDFENDVLSALKLLKQNDIKPGKGTKH